MLSKSSECKEMEEISPRCELLKSAEITATNMIIRNIVLSANKNDIDTPNRASKSFTKYLITTSTGQHSEGRPERQTLII